MTELRLVAHAATAALRAARCGAGEDDLDPAGRAAAVALPAAALRRPDRVWTSPAPAARQTAAALGHPGAVPEAALADRGWGRWHGTAPADLPVAELAAWVADPAQAPPGGEPLAALRARVDAWLAGRAEEPGRAAAVTHPAVVRAALLAALGLPDAAFARLDVAPLSITVLRRRGTRWALYLPPAH
ncbi:hypothetical protein GCM10010123_06750 [Pilimelia anulata]|uniref:Phosphoglycerate mutase n=1 Tax=Pilimelia anulata TaxID=53371 RepID=A0A8J3B276_9ACTN|nr:histidine phosphatase family protein [Pilimelia anulata]GGJ79485.1 hypothetical protein GCM10010123_06750 [Pilimelia anulata]